METDPPGKIKKRQLINNSKKLKNEFKTIKKND